MNRVVEIRSYKLKPGSGPAFDALVRHRSVPLLLDARMDVVAFGRSLDDPDAYYLIRAYDSVAHLKSSQEAFYGSAVWRQGPRESIVALIESDANIVVALTNDAIDALRRGHAEPGPNRATTAA